MTITTEDILAATDLVLDTYGKASPTSVCEMLESFGHKTMEGVVYRQKPNREVFDLVWNTVSTSGRYQVKIAGNTRSIKAK